MKATTLAQYAAGILLSVSLTQGAEAREANVIDLLSATSLAQTLFWQSSSLTTTEVTSHSINAKETVARAAIEDAAAYYDSGKVSGVLPAVLPELKKLMAQDQGTEISEITDLEAVDALTESAHEILSR